MRNRAWMLPLVTGCVLVVAQGCKEEDEPVPLEDDYVWTVQSGSVCIPSEAHTGSDEPIPVRYEMCVYRCIGASGPFDHQWGWSCTGGVCQFDLVPYWDMEKVVNETECDERDLLDPPDGECNMVEYEFNVSPPVSGMGEYIEKTFTINVPYLDMEQSAAFADGIDAGDGFRDSLEAALGGLQVIPERQFDVELSSSAPVATHDDLGSGDCQEIALPDFAGG